MAIVPTECHSKGARWGKFSLFLDSSDNAASLFSGSLSYKIYCTTMSYSGSLEESFVYLHISSESNVNWLLFEESAEVSKVAPLGKDPVESPNDAPFVSEKSKGAPRGKGPVDYSLNETPLGPMVKSIGVPPPLGKGPVSDPSFEFKVVEFAV